MSDLPEGLRYRAFLSYRSIDRKMAARLHRKLEGYRIPRRLVGKPGTHGPVPSRISPVFHDRNDARTANDIETAIRAYLAMSQHLIVLCTPSSVDQKSWVSREIEIFREVRPGADIHAIIGAGEPPACIPRPLLSVGSDGLVQAPLAADLRSPKKGGDGKRKALVKLVAGIAGLEFDQLWRREMRRRAAQLLFLSVLAIIVLVAGGMWLHDRESTRLATILSTAKTIDRNVNGDLADLMLIAAGPPAKGGTVTPTPVQVEGIRSIARRAHSPFAGAIAQLHSDLNSRIVAISDDRRLIFSMAEAEHGGLFIWNVPSNRLAARLPTEMSDWFNATTNDRWKESSKPLALHVSHTGRSIAAVYAPGEGPQRIVANWKIDANGSCTSPCLPETFSFRLPGSPQGQALPGHPASFINHSGMDAHLTLSGDAAEALYNEVGSQPYRIRFSAKEAKPVASLSAEEQARCTFSVPEPLVAGASSRSSLGETDGPPLPPVTNDLPPPPPLNENGEAIWSDDDAQVIARLRIVDHTLAFFSGPMQREVARLKLPNESSCSIDCNVDVVFLDQGHRALIANTKNSAASSAGRMYGALDLEHCRFEAWPPVEPVSLIPRHIAPVPGHPWKAHSVSSLVASKDQRFIGTVLAISAQNHLSIPLIYGVEERAPIALSKLHSDASELETIEALTRGDGDYPFEVLMGNATVPIRQDGTPGQVTRFDNGDRRARLEPSGLPVWSWMTRFASEPNQWRMMDYQTGRPGTPVDFYGDKISKSAVSRDGKLLAIGQSGAIYLQPANARALTDARRLDVSDAQQFHQLCFSPDGQLLGALTSPDFSDNAVRTLSIWRTSTGERTELLTMQPSDRLLAINDDGSVIVESAEMVSILHPASRRSIPLFKARYGQLAEYQSGIFGTDREGKLWKIHPGSPLEAPRIIDFMNGKELIAASPDGKVVYVSDFHSDYLINTESGHRQQLYVSTSTGASAFSKNGRFAIAVKEGNREKWKIEIWDYASMSAVNIAAYHGHWDSLQEVWFSQDDSELWALDNAGKLYRWDLMTRYVNDVAAACQTLRESGARMEFTNAELAAFPALSWMDKAPCSRTGPLNIDYYLKVVQHVLNAVAGN